MSYLLNNNRFLYHTAKLNPNPSGLVLFLDARNKLSYSGTGSTWYDLSGNNNHCILGDPSLPLTNPPTYNPSRRQFEFNKLTFTKAIVPHSSTLNFGTGDFTIVHKSEWNVKQGIGNSVLWKGARFDSNVPTGWTVTAGANGDVTPSIFNILSNASYHYEIQQSYIIYPESVNGLMRRGGMIYSITNGVATHYGINTMDVDTTFDINIGYNVIHNAYWSGNLSNVLIYNRGISDDELTYLNTRYNSILQT